MNKLSGFQELQNLRKALFNHRIYNEVKGEVNMRIFMQSHVFAVWDFMSLLKGLQRSLTCTRKIWTPPAYNNTARFINEIVLGEETDVHPDGKNHASHFEIYLMAMR